MRRAIAILLWLACAAAAQETPRWEGLEFLLGRWAGAGGGQPGTGAGKFSFEAELNGQVIVRRSFNQLEKGARHEDLLVLYADGPNGAKRAMYWDTEGHVIRYRVSTPEVGRVVFESEGEGPGFRLSYWMAGREMKGKFEVGGKTYVEWSAKKEAE